MGFEPPENAYKLTFADGPYAGLEVTLRGFDVGEVLKNKVLAASGELQDDFTRLVDMIVEKIDSWNVTRKGVPLEPTEENIHAQAPKMMWAIFKEWAEAVAGVPAPLDEPSISGETLPEVSIPMETSPPSPPS